MDALLQFARTHLGTTIAIAAALLAGIYFLLNLKPAATKDAERRVAQLREREHDRYRELHPPK